MSQTFISKSVFELVFDEIMKDDIIRFPDGSSIKDYARCIMRNQRTGKEIEFTDLETAFSYFEDNSHKLRVMDLNGGIYFDTY